MVGEGEEVLGVVRNDYHPLSDRVFTVGGSYKALGINAKRAIDMGIMLVPKTHEKGEGAVKPGSYVFVPEGRDGGAYNGLS